MSEEPIIVGFSTLELCPACQEQNHLWHQGDHMRDGELLMCPCKGECDDSFRWPHGSRPLG